MVLPSNIKVKKWYWNLIPWINYRTLQAIYPNIYLPPGIFNDLKTNKPDPYNVARLIHEQEHIKRMTSLGWLLFFFKYIFSPGFRFNEELLANNAAMKYIKSRGLTWDLEVTAKRLSSWLYLWPISYKIAKSELTRTWKNI